MHSSGLVAEGKAMSVADRPRMPVLASSCAYPECSDTKIAAAKNGSGKSYVLPALASCAYSERSEIKIAVAKTAVGNTVSQNGKSCVC